MRNWFGVAVVVLVVLVGCTRDASVPHARGEFGASLKYDPSVPVAGGRPVHLTFWTQVDQEEIYRQLINDYIAMHPNVRIDLVSSSYQDHFPKLQAALNAGIGPDLFHFHNAFHRELFRFMAPYPDAILPREALEQDFRQVGSHVMGGKLYYIDTGLMTSAIYYSTKAWKEAGLTPADIPKTWSQLASVARKLTKRNAQGQVVQSGFNPNGIGWSIVVALNLQQGQTLFSPTGNHPRVDTPETRRSLAWLQSLYEAGGPADRHLPEFQESFGQGTSAMIYGWGWVNNWLAKNDPQIAFDTFPLPSWSEAVPAAYDRNNGESTPCVNSASSLEKQAVAFDLLKFFLVSDSYLTQTDKIFSLVPSKRTLADTSSFARILDRTVWPGLLPVDYESILTDRLVDPIVLDHLAVATALDDTQRTLSGVLESLQFESRESDYAHTGDFATSPEK